MARPKILRLWFRCLALLCYSYLLLSKVLTCKQGSKMTALPCQNHREGMLYWKGGSWDNSLGCCLAHQSYGYHSPHECCNYWTPMWKSANSQMVDWMREIESWIFNGIRNLHEYCVIISFSKENGHRHMFFCMFGLAEEMREIWIWKDLFW